MVPNPTGHGPENECASEGKQQLQITDPSSSPRGCYTYNDYDRMCSIEKKNSGRESQGTRRQDEMIGGIQPVVK
jgi:hypothetical protein